MNTEKLKNELTGFNDKGLPRFAGAMAKAIEAMLESFCEQDERFAEKVLSSNKTLTDCVKSVLSGTQYVLSDVEAYRKAVAFYIYRQRRRERHAADTGDRAADERDDL